MAEEHGPRISVNKLGEYMVASFVRQRGILRDQKRESTVKSARYAKAEAPVLEFLTQRSTDPLHKAADQLDKAPPGRTAWQESDRQSTMDALEAVARLDKDLLLDKWHYSAPPRRARKLNIAGVEISVQPHALVHSTHRGAQVFGALRFHYIRDGEKSLSKRGGEFVAALLHLWCTQNSHPGAEARSSCSLSVDVFSGKITAAPTSTIKLMDNIEAACEEIALKWPTA